MIKKLSSFLLALVLLGGSCLAEEALVTNLAPYAGVWCSIGANDSIPYIALHADGTLTAYDYGPSGIPDNGTKFELSYSGAYTLDESGFRFPGEERVYTVYAEKTDREYESSDMLYTRPAGTQGLWFVAEPVETPDYDYDPSRYYMAVEARSSLLPSSRQDLLGGWYIYEEEEDVIPYITFNENGTVVFRDGGLAVYALDNGRLTITSEGVPSVFYLQYTVRASGEMDDFAQMLYAEDLEQNPDWDFVRNKNLLLVTELHEDGSKTSFLLNLPNG